MTTPARPFPWLTAAVLVLTAGPSIAGLLDPAVLRSLERTPAALDGQWWRLLSPLVAQDGGVPGTVVNLVALAVLGAAAERTTGLGGWLAAYLGAGLVGELVAHDWQPVGAGNSVAVCGLAGLVTVALLRRDPRSPSWAALPVLLWAGGLAGGVSTPLLVVCVVAAGLSVRLLGAYAGALTAAGVLVAGVVLCLGQDVHGAALLAGIAIAGALRTRGQRSTYAPTQRSSSA